MHTSGSSKAGWFVAAAIGLVIFMVLMVAIGGNPFKSDLEVLNDNVDEYNEALAEAESRINGFTAADQEAQQLRATVDDVSDSDPTYLGVVDGHLTAARGHFDAAQQQLAQAGQPLTHFEKHSKEADQQVGAAMDHASQANDLMVAAYNELDAIKQLMNDLNVEYVRTFIWFEVGDWWNSEWDDWPSGDACYYGEVYSLIDANGNVTETIIDDGKDKSWKAFTVDDYEYLVANGIVPAMDKSDPSRGDVGKYLCGEKPQDGKYGALGEPEVTLVKEQGTLALSQEDEDAMVGNERYGAWCAPDGSGEYKSIPEGEAVPQTAEWCWHMPEGGNPGFYYLWLWNGSSWGYSQGPRRCYDCSTQTWSGGSLVPAGQMAQVTGMDAPSIRNPPPDGGPGSGK